ncbi:hypothetical protein J5N97_007905 [Dioscorea zingiberensis]|uniref:RING-type domain-containing protein n=1 Tax=Dioscorea zingiberensis TaxID=325984 RepID=A0A9D5DDI5_9LILI|nr:hypothetical protein J5N97_007905 [Dioscorea zingiberensis]
MLIILIRSTQRNINWSLSRTILSLDIPIPFEQRISMHKARDFTEELTAKRIVNRALLRTFIAHNMPPLHRHNLVREFTTYIRSTIPIIMNMVNLPGVFYELDITTIQHVLKYPDERQGEDINNEEHVRAHRVEAHEDCPICFDELVPRRDAWMPCHHRFHPKCIVTWLEDTDSCPLCRHRLRPSFHLDQES